MKRNKKDNKERQQCQYSLINEMVGSSHGCKNECMDKWLSALQTYSGIYREHPVILDSGIERGRVGGTSLLYLWRLGLDWGNGIDLVWPEGSRLLHCQGTQSFQLSLLIHNIKKIVTKCILSINLYYVLHTKLGEYVLLQFSVDIINKISFLYSQKNI